MILFAASGENKAQAVHDAFFGEVSNACPASFLQLYKGPIVVVVDEKAASKIKDKI
jgi:glucosamine-6-phosphate deaminase